MSYRSHTAAPSRVFDHLYDPVFTTSDQKNVYKENCIALTRSAPIHVYPVYRSMFSELNYEQRNCYAYQKNLLPSIAFSRPSPTSERCQVTGVDRAKFFSNPMGNIRTINVGLMADDGAERVAEAQVIKYRSTSIQTTYRESSAQTRPWLPEITCYDDVHFEEEMPEVVYIADMIDSVTYPGLREVEIIERARKRRSWEMALPPIKAADEIPSRVAAVEAFEWEEWIAREKDINECQQARLKIVADLIAKREQKHQNATSQKLENCKKRILVERKQQKDHLIRNYQRSMRKLDLAQRRGSNKEKINDPVLSHYDKKMEYSLPKIRLDATSKKRTQVEYTNDFAAKFNLLEQDNSALGDLQKYLKSNKRELWLPKEQTKEVERGIWSENYLKKLHETLKQFRRKKHSKRKLPKCLVYDESASTNDSSMSALAQAPDDAVDEIYQNTVCVQKNIKGRAIQSMLKRGMEKFHDVIEEAKETHSIAAIRKLFPKEFSQQIDNQEQILDEYKRVEEALKNDEKLQEELKKVECRDAGNLLNFLEKELHRLEGEKRAHALYLLAERERYSRQAATMGKAEFEEQFRNDAITLYLENILLEGVHRAADDNSREYIRKVAKKIDRKASKTVTFDERVAEFSDESNTEDVSEDSLKIDEIPDEKVVMELLKDNVMPQILNRIKSEHLIVQQKKYLMAAHQDLFKLELAEAKLEQERNICVDILNDMFDVATADYPYASDGIERRESKEAEVLASQIVEQILNEMIETNFEFSPSSSEVSSSNGSYDGDYSNVQSTSSADSSTDILANQVVQSILNEIMENTFSSTTEYTETQTSDTN